MDVNSFADRIHASFARQGIMGTLGASLGAVELGQVEILLPFGDHVSQQHGYFHGGVVATLCDSAAGYAAYSHFSATESVLTVEFKINFIAAAYGQNMRALGKVIKLGGALVICEMNATVFKDGKEVQCAHGLATMMRIAPRAGTNVG